MEKIGEAFPDSLIGFNCIFQGIVNRPRYHTNIINEREASAYFISLKATVFQQVVVKGGGGLLLLGVLLAW